MTQLQSTQSIPYILIVEDDPSLADWIGDYLLENQFEIAVANRGDEAARLVKEENPDLVLLDINLPVMNGFDVCREIRTFYNNPVLMLTARGEESDEVVGLLSGANDYMIKPVRPKAMLARINTLLGRNPALSGLSSREFGDFRINADSRSVFLGNDPVTLSTHEFDLLWVLVENAGSVMSRDDIVSRLRGIEYDGFDRSIDILVSRLRKKIGDDSSKPTRIKTVWGKGYMLAPDAWL